MVARIALAAIDPSNARKCRSRRREYTRQPSVPVASDRLAPARCPTQPRARQYPWPVAEIAFGGRVDEEVAHPHPSQSRTCRFPASGSSWESLARGGADDTIRDLPA